MGYYTTYELEVIGKDVEIPASFIEEAKKYGIAVQPEIDHHKAIADMSGYDYIFGDSIKWYDHEKEMRGYSQMYPNLVFKLSGEGEESGDIWVKYFKNGKMQVCKVKITFDDFDETKLK